jgi:hypothetical protein
MNNLVEDIATEKALIDIKTSQKVGGKKLGRVTKNW